MGTLTFGWRFSVAIKWLSLYRKFQALRKGSKFVPNPKPAYPPIALRRSLVHHQSNGFCRANAR